MSEGHGRLTMPSTQRSRSWIRRSLPLFGVTGALLATVLVFLGYDYISVRTSPCEAIFRQASLGLSTKIGFLRAEGEVTIGREPLMELTERAQMTALNLKTCCTVLHVGRLDPEQFLQCKGNARAYEEKLGEIVTAIGSVARPATLTGIRNANQPESTPSPASQASAKQKRNLIMAAPKIRASIEENIKAARQISQSFNREIVEIRQSQTLETLKLTTPSHVEVAAQEKEPNNDGLNSNVVPLGAWVSASIGDASDADVFGFQSPPVHRDWISVEIDNRSTTLEPRIGLFSRDKSSLGSHHSTTPGAGLAYRFVSGPDERYQVRVSSYYGKSTGGYLIRVTATKSYDTHEPNDNILTARSVPAGTEIQAAIMDGKDQDYFRVAAPKGVGKIEVKVTNASATLRPRIDIFDGSKAQIGDKSNTTGGGDITYLQSVKPDAAFHIRIGDYYGSAAGAYRLMISFPK